MGEDEGEKREMSIEEGGLDYKEVDEDEGEKKEMSIEEGGLDYEEGGMDREAGWHAFMGQAGRRETWGTGRGMVACIHGTGQTELGA